MYRSSLRTSLKTRTSAATFCNKAPLFPAAESSSPAFDNTATGSVSPYSNRHGRRVVSLFPVPSSLLPFFFLLLVGCGVPGEPLPPLLEIPVAVSDLAAVQVGNHIELTWSVPRMTTEGTVARGLDRMEVHVLFAS